jgi:hypothetical protein
MKTLKTAKKKENRRKEKKEVLTAKEFIELSCMCDN